MPVLWSTGAVAVVTLLAGLLPLGALLAGLGRKGRVSAAFVGGRAAGHAATLALVFGLGVLAQGAVFALAVLLGSKIIEALKLVAPAQDLAFVALFAIALGLALVLGVVRDLASAAAVRDDLRFYDAASRALRCVRRAGRLARCWRGPGEGCSASPVWWASRTVLASPSSTAPALAARRRRGAAPGGYRGDDVRACFMARGRDAAALDLGDGGEPREAPEAAPPRDEEEAPAAEAARGRGARAAGGRSGGDRGRGEERGRSPAPI